jgi:glycosidase
MGKLFLNGIVFSKRLKISLSKLPNIENDLRRPFYEFHIHADVRKKYQFDDSLYTISGNVIFPNVHAVRVFAHKINTVRNAAIYPERAIKAGQLNAMALIDEIFHYVVRVYDETINTGFLHRGLTVLSERAGAGVVYNTLLEFTDQFPPLEVYQGKSFIAEWLQRSTHGKPHREMSLEELMMLYFANINPAFNQFKELFDDTQLSRTTPYRELIQETENYSRQEKGIGPKNLPLFDFLRAPILASPNSLEGQLQFIKREWGMILSSKYASLLARADDFLKEETKITFGGGAGPTVVPQYTLEELNPSGEYDSERFTQDTDWMPNVVLLAKNTYVWLDQLSKKYQRSITRLDQIPNEELDQLARWNITGLWFIGIWERSHASKKIKQMMGNPEAAASAYSVFEYEIAKDLGGEEAFSNLAHRAWQRGIRLAGDMVPNHMGIDSKWVVQHPDYFIQSEFSPFPNYRFTGENLSENPNVQIRIEDGYWNRSDAAVVFQFIENHTGRVRYIYHGNDGTHTPWNDTAQLNFLKPEVREAVIQAILHVARKFPIIRFDAAMVLTKQHYQRLWFPLPGKGGDIPSRADYAMTKAEFDKQMPQEFWREVVDRINQEMPNTLLLAEAFWLLEGYFVRTLGMHRVYNSAFMNMLMKEENSKYRELIRNTLEFNPEILKRYVNFMSNPDEKTAVEQFGKGDKYFGVAMMMVTLPGLPMFAHGQIEGYSEKYGMEYRKAYYDEHPDQELIRRHEREVFPILNKRYLFSQVENFELYNFYDVRGFVNENVFAYSHRVGNERAIFFYHNKYEETRGWVKRTVNKVVSGGGDNQKQLSSKELSEALGLRTEDNVYYIFRDHASGLEYLRSGKSLHSQGLYVELKAYQYHLFCDFREVYDTAGEYQQLSDTLHGKGVPSIQEALQDVMYAPIHESVQHLLSKDSIHAAIDYLHKRKTESLHPLLQYYKTFVKRAKTSLPGQCNEEDIVQRFNEDIVSLKDAVEVISTMTKEGKIHFEVSFDSKYELFTLLSWSAFRQFDNADSIQTLRLGKVLNRCASDLGIDTEPDYFVHLLRILNKTVPLIIADKEKLLPYLFDDNTAREFIKINSYNNTWYYNKERFEELLLWFVRCGVLLRIEEKRTDVVNDITKMINWYSKTIVESDEAKYQVDKLKKLLMSENILFENSQSKVADVE